MSFHRSARSLIHVLSERNPRLAGIPWNERANGPGKGRDIIAANERVQRIVTTSRQLDERAERIVALELNGGSRSWGRERVGAKKRIGAGEYHIAREGLPECNDWKRARKEPRSGGRGGEGYHRYEDRRSGPNRVRAHQA